MAALLLWFSPLGLVSQILWRFLEAPWQRCSAWEAPQGDAIVVLSGGRHPAPGSARVSEWHDPDRFLAGLELFRAGKAPRLIFTGGASLFSPGQRPEGEHYLQRLSYLEYLQWRWQARHQCSTQQRKQRPYAGCCGHLKHVCC